MSLDTAKAYAIQRSLTAKFNNAISSAEPFYPMVSTIVQSNGADEEYGLLGNMPGVREWVGPRIFNELRAAKFTVTNKLWEASLLFEKDNIADDRIGLYGPIMEQLAIEAGYHPDELLFETMIVGGATTLCFDGQYFYDTDHSWGSSGTLSNLKTYNASDHTAVTAAEFKAAFIQAKNTMLDFKNDQGKLLNRPTTRSLNSLLCVVPTELYQPAEEAFQSVIISNSSNIVLDRPKVICSPHLTDAASWYLFNLGTALKPFVFQAREPLSVSWKGADDIETKELKCMTRARYNMGYLAWWTSVKTTFN